VFLSHSLTELTELADATEATQANPATSDPATATDRIIRQRDRQGDAHVSSTPDPEQDRDAIAALFARRQQAFDDLDSAALAADYADDVLIDSPISGQHGKADAVRNLDLVFDAFVDMKVATTALIIDPPWVVQTARIEGSNLGRLFGAPPSGKPFRISAAFVYKLRDGRIIYEQRIYDFTSLLDQVGGTQGQARVTSAPRGLRRGP
jgi:steroid delta-isomerase-like uncharacterized protein